MEEYEIARRCVVSGKVQGVWFRASAKREADRLGVTGHAKNLPDGSVEVLVYGEEDAVLCMIEWLRQGPPLARVERVEVTEAAGAAPASFETK